MPFRNIIMTDPDNSGFKLKFITMQIYYTIGFILLMFLAIITYVTKPHIARKYIIRNNIQAQVDSRRHFKDSEKLSLLKELIDDIDFDKLEIWQIDAFVDIIFEKIIFAIQKELPKQRIELIRMIIKNKLKNKQNESK